MTNEKKFFTLLGLFILAFVVLVVVEVRQSPQSKTEQKYQRMQPPVVAIEIGPGAYYHVAGTHILTPNPLISPGKSRTQDLSIICGHSTKEYRHTSEATKMLVYRRYGVAPHLDVCADTIRITKSGKKVTETCEIDHIIPLELGGADELENLWPQPYNPQNGFGAHAKDEVENFLHNEVCAGNISILEAQRLIVTSWSDLYQGGLN